MDYEQLCNDLLQMARKAQFWATWAILERDSSRANMLLGFAAECQDFRYDLFLDGHGVGGY